MFREYYAQLKKSLRDLKQWIARVRLKSKEQLRHLRDSSITQIETNPLGSLVFTVLFCTLVYIVAETIKAKNLGFERTLWEWMELLVVPIMLGFGAYLLNRADKEKERKRETAEKEREHQITEERRRKEESERQYERQILEERRRYELEVDERRWLEGKSIADQRERIERTLLLDRQRQDAIEMYFDRIKELLLLKSENPDKPNVSAVIMARAWTLNVLRNLDRERKRQVFQMLYDSYLTRTIPPQNEDRSSGLGLSIFCETDLRDISFVDASFVQAHFHGCILSKVIFKNALLHKAEFINTHKHEVDLSSARLFSTKMPEAKLSGNLQGIKIYKTDLTHVIAPSTNFTHAIIFRSFFYQAELVNSLFRRAIIRDTDFTEANLEGADLSESVIVGPKTFFKITRMKVANLTGSRLVEVDLSGSDLRYANLRNVTMDIQTQRSLERKWFIVWSLLNDVAADRNLQREVLNEANLNGVNLDNANLQSAELRDTLLIGASLQNANLTSADLRGADLTDADLSWAFLAGTLIDDNTRIAYKWLSVWEVLNINLIDKDISGEARLLLNDPTNQFPQDTNGGIRKDLQHLDLSKANLIECDLIECDLTSANLSLSYLQYSQLARAKLNNANLQLEFRVQLGLNFIGH